MAHERPLLPATHRTERATQQMAEFHRDYLDEVRAAVDANDVVVVGMSQNPSVPRARKLLQAAGIAHAYVGHGSYLSGYRRRLAVKMWSGFPTFPQVFVKGVLVGGASDVAAELSDGTLQQRLAAARPAR